MNSSAPSYDGADLLLPVTSTSSDFLLPQVLTGASSRCGPTGRPQRECGGLTAQCSPWTGLCRPKVLIWSTTPWIKILDDLPKASWLYIRFNSLTRRRSRSMPHCCWHSMCQYPGGLHVRQELRLPVPKPPVEAWWRRGAAIHADSSKSAVPVSLQPDRHWIQGPCPHALTLWTAQRACRCGSAVDQGPFQLSVTFRSRRYRRNRSNFFCALPPAHPAPNCRWSFDHALNFSRYFQLSSKNIHLNFDNINILNRFLKHQISGKTNCGSIKIPKPQFSGKFATFENSWIVKFPRKLEISSKFRKFRIFILFTNILNQFRSQISDFRSIFHFRQ